jgi:hypothetical protein
VRWRGAPGYRLAEVDLAGRPIAGRETHDGVADEVDLDLGPWRIQTLRATCVSG